MRASGTYDLAVFGSGYLARLAGCLLAKSGQRVLRVPLDQPEPEASIPWPSLWPMDLTRIEGPREMALELGILVPLRDHLQERPLLGQYVASEGTGELFSAADLLAAQAKRFAAKGPFGRFSSRYLKRQAAEISQSEQGAKGKLFEKPRLLRRRAHLSKAPKAKPTLRALDQLVACHPWTGRNGQLVLGGGRRFDERVVPNPLNRFVELAENVSRIEVMEPGSVVDVDMKGRRIEALVTSRGQRIQASELIYCGGPGDIEWGPVRKRQQLVQRWEEDLGSPWEQWVWSLRVDGRAWPEFLVGPLFFEDLGLAVQIAHDNGQVHLWAHLDQEEQGPELMAALRACLPWMAFSVPETQHYEMPCRADLTAPLPSFRELCSNLLFTPDRLVAGMGLNQPFWAARDLAALLRQD